MISLLVKCSFTLYDTYGLSVPANSKEHFLYAISFYTLCLYIKFVHLKLDILVYIVHSSVVHMVLKYAFIPRQSGHSDLVQLANPILAINPMLRNLQELIIYCTCLVMIGCVTLRKGKPRK